MYCRLLQQEDGCQPSLLPRLSAVMVQARQFSSGESNGSSVHPNSGTVSLVRAHSHTPSSSMSLPESQNSERRRRELDTAQNIISLFDLKKIMCSSFRNLWKRNSITKLIQLSAAETESMAKKTQ